MRAIATHRYYIAEPGHIAESGASETRGCAGPTLSAPRVVRRAAAACWLVLIVQLLFLGIGLLQLAWAGSAWAQDTLAADPAGFSVPPLPDLSQGQAAIAVGGVEAQSFSSIIPDALYPMLRAGDVAINVVAHSPWETALGGDEWNQAPGVECLSGKGLATDALWSKKRFPCGSRLTIEKIAPERPSTGAAGESEEVRVDSALVTAALIDESRGRRYLLNAERAVTMAGLSRTELLVQSTGVALSEGTLRVERLAPQLIAAGAGKLQGSLLWREKLSWLEPRTISGAGMLTLRFKGVDEDMVFQRSPISERYRQLTGSNRGDGIYGLPLAADDLSVWAAKTEWMETAKLVRIRKLLVPVLKTERITLRAGEPGCFEGQVSMWANSSALAVWAHDLIFSPRDVAEIEVVSGDPFSLTGKMRVFVDSETMLPILKVVYDRAGQQERIVMGSIMGLETGLQGALPSDGGVRAVYNAVGPVVSFGTRGRASVIYPQFLMVCDANSESLNEQLFDLNTVMPKTGVSKTGAQKKAAPHTTQLKSRPVAASGAAASVGPNSGDAGDLPAEVTEEVTEQVIDER